MPLDRATPRALLALVLVLGLAACQTGTEDEPTPSAAPTTQAPTEEAPDDAAGEESDDDGADDDRPEADDAEQGPVTNGPNVLSSPAPGATVDGSTVTVSGEGTAFEGTLNYHVLDAATGDVVVPVDYTNTGANGEIGPWSIDLELEPGEYRVEVWEPGMADEGQSEGTDGRLNLVAVTFTVS